MSRVILLDTHPLSQIAHPRIDTKARLWLTSLREDGIFLRVPEISDYELRRELVRKGKRKSIDKLNQLRQTILIPITPETMLKAAELWAWVRNQGKPTASNDSLDGDVILAAQAILQLKEFDEVIIIITTNTKHLLAFKNQGISIIDWQTTLNNLSST
jgi:predicted nucleic acid-binding protein